MKNVKRFFKKIKKTYPEREAIKQKLLSEEMETWGYRKTDYDKGVTQ